MKKQGGNTLGIERREVLDEEFGRCIYMENHFIHLMVSIDYGPRIVSLGFLDGENLFYHDEEGRHVHANDEWKAYYGEERRFHLYGGHRLAVAPDRMPQSYYPDTEPVVYTPLTGGMRFTPPKQRENDLQFSLDVMMGEDASDLMLVQYMKNCSHEEKRLSLSGCTMFAPGGVAILPQNRGREEKHLPNRNVTMWPFSSFRDERLSLGDRYILVQQAESDRLLKFGINDVLGWAAYSNRGVTVLKRFVHTQGQVYPDFGSSLEMYLCSDYAELRSLSPLVTLAPGETLRHVENLALMRVPDLKFGASEEQVEAFVYNLKL